MGRFFDIVVIKVVIVVG